MPKLIIDGTEIETENGITLLQACEEAGAEIPRFCYHERLSIAGNCRMCLVEVKGMPKPQASCALSVNDLRPGPDGAPPEISTRSETVRRAREGVMEFLLINHPLDCPICDQGGECDLQDQAMAYGVDKSRFHENKRAVEDKYIGPLVKTIMTRCIHCTRCIRFVAEVGGVEELGATGRGEDMEITTYLEKAMTSEMSGNVIDLCPVGALTSKPYAFAARPWELRKTESVDVMDAVGSSIRVDTRGREVMRILPRLNEAVNEEWISDKTRFIWDGLKTQRLDRPYIRRNGKLAEASWQEAFAAIARRVKKSRPQRMAALAGDLVAAEEMFALKSLMDSLGVTSLDCRQDGAAIDVAAGRAGYLFNSTIAGIEDADAILLIGANPRLEAPVINARIRKAWRATDLPIGVIGDKTELHYDYAHLGAGPESLKALVDGKEKFASTLEKAQKPLVIIGMGALSRPDGGAVLAMAAKLAIAIGASGGASGGANGGKDGWNGFSVLHDAAARVAGLDLGFVPGKGGKDTRGILKAAKAGELDLLYLLGADEIPAGDLGDTFVVYQGTHGDRGAHRADVILPGAAYTEKNGTYVNTEGRVQAARRAAYPPGDGREDWAILRALSDVLGHKLPFDNLEQLRAVLYEAHPHFAAIDEIAPADENAVATLARKGGRIGSSGFASGISSFHMSNPVARASAVMAECASLAAGGAKTGTKGTGTDG